MKPGEHIRDAYAELDPVPEDGLAAARGAFAALDDRRAGVSAALSGHRLDESQAGS